MDQRAKQAKQERFLEWCKNTGQNPKEDGAWDSFNETDQFWEDMDENDREGWTDNMNKEWS